MNILIQWEKAAWLFWPLALVTFLALACTEFWPLLTKKEPAVLPISTAEATIDKGSDESENQGSS